MDDSEVVISHSDGIANHGHNGEGAFFHVHRDTRRENKMSWVKATHTDSSPHRPIFVNLSTVKTLQRSATEASTIVKFIDGTTLAVTEEPDALLKDA